MYYRVVLQGHVANGLDVEQVKREFMRITALPESVTNGLFGGTPKVIKRQMRVEDAERIALTLRAIGAAATIERELQPAPVPEMLGPPTLAPLPGGHAVPLLEEAPAAMRQRVALHRPPVPRWLLWLAGVAASVALVAFGAPLLTDGTPLPRNPAPAPAPVKVVATELAQPAVIASFDAANLYGPWRCTNQNTGLSLYWLYREDGTLGFFGETEFALGRKPVHGAGVPLQWSLRQEQLLWTYADDAAGTAVVNTVLSLSLARLRYNDATGEPIVCGRP